MDMAEASGQFLVFVSWSAITFPAYRNPWHPISRVYGVGSEYRDKGKEDGGDHSALYVGEHHLGIRLHPGGTQVPGRLQEGEVEFVDGGKEREYGIGKVHIDQDEDHRPLVIKKLEAFGLETQKPQSLVDETFVAQNRDPRIDAHEKVGPEGHDHEEKPQCLVFRTGGAMIRRASKRRRFMMIVTAWETTEGLRASSFSRVGLARCRLAWYAIGGFHAAVLMAFSLGKE
jgi:hypothetical protein